MKLNARSSFFVGVAASLAIAGCSSSSHKSNDARQAQASDRARDVAAIPPESAKGIAQRPFLGSDSWLDGVSADDKAATKAFNFKKEHVDRLLSVLYRTDAYIDLYEKDLDQMLKQAAANPNSEVDPLATESYAEIQKMWAIYGQGIAVITENYRELLQAQYDTSSPERSKRASALLKEVHASLSELPPEDKIQLQILFREMAEAQAEFKTAKNENGNGKKSSRGVASVAVNFENYVYNDYPRLKKDLAKYSKVMARKAKKAFNYKDPEFNASYSVGSEGRTPASRLVPDAGGDGNVIGSVFPNNTWTLTYDDGPKSSTTSTLMDYLSKHSDALHPNGAPATFFWLAKNVKEMPDIIAKGKKLGFSLQNHSWSHANLAKANSATLQREVVESTQVENAAYGKPIKFFRCPYGACFAPKVPVVRQMIADLGLIHAYWAVDSLDWKLLNAQRVFDFTVKEMKLRKRGVILMHDIHPTTVEASRLLLNYIKNQNNSGAEKIRLLTLDDAVDIVNGVSK